MELRERLRSALPAAMKRRDAAAVAALRSALAAVDNAEAVDDAPPPPDGHADLAGSVAGVGATEVPRRALTADEIAALVRAEVEEREAAADGYERAGAPARAARLRAEAAVLAAHLSAS